MPTPSTSLTGTTTAAPPVDATPQGVDEFADDASSTASEVTPKIAREYKIGDLVLGRTEGYPPWPGRVRPDPSRA